MVHSDVLGSGKGGSHGMIKPRRGSTTAVVAHLRFTNPLSATSLFNFRFLGCGLGTREHSAPFLWHGTQASSSSLMVVHRRCSRRQESQGPPDGVLAREWGAEKSNDDTLPRPRSNLPSPSCWCVGRRLFEPDKDAELSAEAWGAAGFGAMAIGAVRETAGE